jgi:hypothetical protein
VSPRSNWCGIVIMAMSVASASAANLSFLRDTAMAYLTEADRSMQRKAALFVLEQAQPDAVREWSNPATGSSGRIEGQGDLISEQGLHCRRIRIVAQARGAESIFVLPVCKDEKGGWFFGSGLKLSPVKSEGRAAVAPGA